MESAYYQNQLFNYVEMDNIPCQTMDIKQEDPYQPLQTDGLVYNHIQQTLQVQTDLKYHQRVQDFLDSAITETDLGFDELYSSVTTESELSYLQMMQQTSAGTPFYTIDNCNMDTTFDISVLPSVAGLDTGLSYTTSQCHPLSDINMPENNGMASDYYLNDNDILAGLDCNAFNTTYKEYDPSPFDYPVLSYPPLLAAQMADNRSYRNNSAPMLSASYSFSSFSSASSNEEDSTEEDAKDTISSGKQRGPKKSASISFLPEHRKKMTMAHRKNSITAKAQRNFSQKHNSFSSDSLSYFLSKQHLSDNEEVDEEYEQEGYHPKMSTSASTSTISKKGRNVDKACNHCKRSHLRCDNVRPCRRCVATGKTGCQDVKHKPRGRPRLQKRQ